MVYLHNIHTITKYFKQFPHIRNELLLRPAYFALLSAFYIFSPVQPNGFRILGFGCWLLVHHFCFQCCLVVLAHIYMCVCVCVCVCVCEHVGTSYFGRRSQIRKGGHVYMQLFMHKFVHA